MAQLIFLNERSHPPGDTHPAVGQRLLGGLAEVLVAVKKIVPRASLICAEPLPTMQLGNGCSISRCLNEPGRIREQARFLLSLGGQAPFRVAKDLAGDPDPGVTVYRCFGEAVEGIGLAHLYGGLPVSFIVAPWLTATLLLDLQQLTDDGESTVSVETVHASSLEHVESHRDWLSSLRRRDIDDAVDVWERRKELFPHLEFGRDIKSNLVSLQPPMFLQVVRYLSSLDDSVARWDPSASPTPEYPPHTTDEHESRKRLCNFPRADGVRVLCSWHGRYTPGPGRIHFRLEAAPKRIILGYIGRKL